MDLQRARFGNRRVHGRPGDVETEHAHAYTKRTVRADLPFEKIRQGLMPDTAEKRGAPEGDGESRDH